MRAADCASQNFFQARRVSPYRSPQKLSFNSFRKCSNCSVIRIGVIFAMGVRILSRFGFACKAKPTYTLFAFTQPKLHHLEKTFYGKDFLLTLSSNGYNI